MNEQDRETYLYQMRYAHFLFRKRGTEALRDLEEYEIAKMRRIWDGIGAEKGRDLETLVRELWEGAGPEFEFSVTKPAEDVVQIECRKCPFVELSRGNGMQEVGFSKFCMSDYGIVAGFNPEIEFSRTTTLMEGHASCNHRYRLKGRGE